MNLKELIQKAKELEIDISDCLDDRDKIERRIKDREALYKITQDYEEAKKVKKAETEEVNFKKNFLDFKKNDKRRQRDYGIDR